VALNIITLTLKLVINNSIGIRYKDMIKKSQINIETQAGGKKKNKNKQNKHR
jgi:hypothetical protein